MPVDAHADAALDVAQGTLADQPEQLLAGGAQEVSRLAQRPQVGVAVEQGVTGMAHGLPLTTIPHILPSHSDLTAPAAGITGRQEPRFPTGRRPAGHGAGTS